MRAHVRINVTCICATIEYILFVIFFVVVYVDAESSVRLVLKFKFGVVTSPHTTEQNNSHKSTYVLVCINSVTAKRQVQDVYLISKRVLTKYLPANSAHET